MKFFAILDYTDCISLGVCSSLDEAVSTAQDIAAKEGDVHFSVYAEDGIKLLVAAILQGLSQPSPGENLAKAKELLARAITVIDDLNDDRMFNQPLSKEVEEFLESN